jgi:hypothetical protein
MGISNAGNTPFASGIYSPKPGESVFQILSIAMSEVIGRTGHTDISQKPPSINPDDDHFARAHGGLHDKRGKQHDGHEPLSWRHLVKPPVIRQWLFKGRLFKGIKERQATYVELFFGKSRNRSFERTD